MEQPVCEISLIASSVRPHLWKDFAKSLWDTNVRYEVVFAGDLSPDVVEKNWFPNLKYVHTGRVKPSQCYEVARRNAQGLLLLWCADDCEFSPHLLDDVVAYWHKDCGFKTLLSVKTNENGRGYDLNLHRFFAHGPVSNFNTPLMAPLGVMAREYLKQLGGFDRRYISGQYENDVAMRVYCDNGEVRKWEQGTVFIEHIKKHGETTKFWSSYSHDRKVLEDTWVIGGYAPAEDPFNVFGGLLTDEEGRVENLSLRPYIPITNREISKVPLLPFEPYEAKDILTVNQGPAGIWGGQ